MTCYVCSITEAEAGYELWNHTEEGWLCGYCFRDYSGMTRSDLHIKQADWHGIYNPDENE